MRAAWTARVGHPQRSCEEAAAGCLRLRPADKGYEDRLSIPLLCSPTATCASGSQARTRDPKAVMALIGADLQKVLDLAPDYTRVPSPSMRARDEACRRLQGELREMLATMPAAAAGPVLDVAVGGRQASYSPLAWVRIYSPEHSPSATAGVYLAYLFAADGSRVYLSLQQGSSEVRSGHIRPVSDPSELLARGAAARSAIRDLIDSPLGAGMIIGIDLGWRRISSVLQQAADPQLRVRQHPRHRV